MKAPGYLRSKAAMSFCGKRLVRWLLEIMRLHGIRQFYVIANGKENRYQTKTLVGFGDELGVNIRYSRVRLDELNTGSADATLRMLDHWNIEQPALVFPTDSLYDFSLAGMVRAHESIGAAVTIAAMAREPQEVAGKYGVLLTRPDGRITDFVEKPGLAELRQAFPTPTEDDFEKLPLWTNAGMYLLDSPAVRKYGQDPEVVRLRWRQLDFGMDFLPWLVGADVPVYAYPADRTGDLGTVVDYIDTMVAMLRGQFRTLVPLMGKAFDEERRIWIHPDTLAFRDEISGKTLEEKLEEGLVEIGSNVRLGRYVEVGPETRITDSNVDDGVDIGEGTEIRRSAIRDGAIIESFARISQSYIGSMVDIRSSRDRPTVLEGYVGVGDEVVVQQGVRLVGRISVFPRVKIPSGVRIPEGSEIRDAEDVLRYL